MRSEWQPPEIRWLPATEHAGSFDERARARRKFAVHLRLFARHARKHPGTLLFDIGLHVRMLSARLCVEPLTWEFHNALQMTRQSLNAAPVKLQIIFSEAIWLARHGLGLRFEIVSTRAPKFPSPWPPETLNQVFMEIHKAERQIDRAVLQQDGEAAVGHHERLLGLVDLSRKISVRSFDEAEVLIRDVASRSRHLKGRRFGKFRSVLKNFCIRLLTPGWEAVRSIEVVAFLRVAEEIDRAEQAECVLDLRRVIDWLNRSAQTQ